MDNQFEVKLNLSVGRNVPGNGGPYSAPSKRKVIHVSVRYTWVDRGK